MASWLLAGTWAWNSIVPENAPLLFHLCDRRAGFFGGWQNAWFAVLQPTVAADEVADASTRQRPVMAGMTCCLQALYAARVPWSVQACLAARYAMLPWTRCKCKLVGQAGRGPCWLLEVYAELGTRCWVWPPSRCCHHMLCTLSPRAWCSQQLLLDGQWPWGEGRRCLTAVLHSMCAIV